MVNIKTIIINNKLATYEVQLDTVLTPELKEEGIVRELGRNIQEMRRELELTPAQKIKLQIAGTAEHEAMITRWQKKIKQDTNLSELHVGEKTGFRIEREIDVDGKRLWIGMR